MTERLRDRGERALVEAIRRLVPRGPGVVLGVGDDAAVLAPIGAPLLVTTDAMVEGVHFRSRWLSPRELGRRAFEVSASDVAAMGGRVLAAVLALAAPPMLPVASLRAIVAGVRDGARRAGGALVGGNLASAGELSLTVIELTEFIERVENAIRIVGDVYLAKVYEAAVAQLRIGSWQAQVTRKLRLLSQTYELLKGEVELSRLLKNEQHAPDPSRVSELQLRIARARDGLRESLAEVEA